MSGILLIAARNLSRLWRRSLLTGGLVAIGVVAVLLFVAAAGSFRAMMIGQITDTFLGHLQVHRRGHVAAIETLPLHLNMTARQAEAVERAAREVPEITAIAPRVKFGAMFSNFTETTNIRVNGIEPDRESAVAPGLPGRFVAGEPAGLLARGEILVPELLARGLQVGVGDSVVLIATNRDGSVNGRTLRVRGIIAGVTGPGGRDGYIHIEDARAILRSPEAEVSEFVLRARDLAAIPRAVAGMQAALAAAGGGAAAAPGAPPRAPFEVHGWDSLSPFANIARLIEAMTFAIRVLLVSIVLVAVMNVMVMAVYERIREIGTIAAMGTPPRRILALFLTEGVLLGAAGVAAGLLLSLLAVAALNRWPITFDFGQQSGLVLLPALPGREILLVSAIVLAVAVLASLQPAWKAARLDPMAALRHV